MNKMDNIRYTDYEQVELEVKQKETIHTFQLSNDEHRKEMDDKIVERIERDGARANRVYDDECGTISLWAMMKEDGFSELASIATTIARDTTPRWHERGGVGKFSEIEVKELWGLKYKPGDYSNSHSHEPALWSFTYYIDPDPSAPGLSFPDSHGDTVIKIQDGLLILFSGSLKHEVKTWATDCNITSGHRYVVSGNIYWKSVCWCESLWK
jgi:hypothetical protein